MNGSVALLGLLGLGFGAGLLVLVHAVRGTDKAADTATGPLWRGWRRREHPGRWLTAAGGAGLLVGALTGWVVGAMLAALAAWSLPQLVRSDGTEQHTARIEGIAAWTEMLRDTLAAAAGLEQTILATAPHAPEAVRPQITDLAARLNGGERLPQALKELADDLANPTADLVIAALVLAASHGTGQIASLLGELAATARGQVEMHQRVAASRARTRTTLRVVMGTTLSFAGGLIVLNPAFLSPYDTVTGQLVLLVIGGTFAAGFAWLRHMARTEEPERFFTALDTIGAAPGAARQEVT